MLLREQETKMITIWEIDTEIICQEVRISRHHQAMVCTVEVPMDFLIKAIITSLLLIMEISLWEVQEDQWAPTVNSEIL